MPPGGGDLQGPLHILLAHDLREVRSRLRLLRPDPGGGGAQPRPAPQVLEQGGGVLHRVDRQPAGQGGLGGVLRRDVQLPDPASGGGHGHGEHPGDGPQGPRQGQLPQKGGLRRRGLDVPLGGQDAQKDGQIVHGALLPQGGGGQVDGDPGHGEAGAAALDGRPDPLSGLLDGGVRKPHHVEGREPARQGALHRDLVACDPLEAEGVDGDDHKEGSFLRRPAGRGAVVFSPLYHTRRPSTNLQ